MRDELEHVDERIQRWEIAFEEGAMPADVGIDPVRALKSRKTEIELTLKNTAALDTVLGPVDDAAIDRFVAHICGVLLGPDRALAKRYLKLLVDRIETDGREVTIHARETTLVTMLEESPPTTEEDFFRTCGPTWLRR